MVRTVLPGVGDGNKIVRAWFGASGQNVTSDIANSVGLPRPIGVLLTDIYPGGPAERAGLKRGDVVLQLEGREVSDGDALRFRVATHPVGSTVQVKAWRDGRERVAPVALIAPPETPPRDTTPLRGNHPLSGATVANLSPALVEELGLREGVPRGVVVVGVRRGSTAQMVRLNTGDVLLRINDREVHTVEDVRKIVTSTGVPWRMAIRRADRVITLVVGG
jgi:S1-C subfamily serine protease